MPTTLTRRELLAGAAGTAAAAALAAPAGAARPFAFFALGYTHFVRPAGVRAHVVG